MRLFESLEFDEFLHSQRRSSVIYTSLMRGVLDVFYDDERGQMGSCMYRTRGFCKTSFTSLGMKFSTFIYPSLSVIIIAIHNSSEFSKKRPGGINIYISYFFLGNIYIITTKTSRNNLSNFSS